MAAAAVVPLHPAIDPACRTCDGEGFVVGTVGERATAQRCACVTACPVCRDGGLVPEDGRPGIGPLNRGVRMQRCSCQRLPFRLERFNDARLPGRHAAHTLRNYVPSPAPLLKTALRVQAVVADWTPGQASRGLVLYGGVGRGKTHLLCGMVRDLVFRRGVTARFIEFSHLVNSFKASFGDGGGESMGALMDQLVRAEVLAIDEIGKGRATDFEEAVIDELVSRRYNTGRGGILATTNYTMGERTGNRAGNLALGALVPLADRVGDRTYSRLRELCDWHEVPGEDWRKGRLSPGLTVLEGGRDGAE